MDASLILGGFNALGSYMAASSIAGAARYTATVSNNIRTVSNQTGAVIDARNNEITASQRWAQSVRNSRVYEAVSKYQESGAINFNRQRDQRTKANFAANIRLAEEDGRQQAAAAASGVTGSVVDVINMTAAIRNQITNSARVTAEKQVDYDYKKQEFDQRLALLDNLDWSTIFNNPTIMDYGRTQATSTVNPLSAAIGSFGIKGLQNLGTEVGNFFNTPSGGSDSLTGFLNLNDNFSSVKV